jgi:hypothetical protein
MGMLMAAAARAGKPLHPTNLHVNEALFPNDTEQSRLPDPEWLERWIDRQNRFDRDWAKRVSDMILVNLSELFDAPIRTLQDLSRLRRRLAA